MSDHLASAIRVAEQDGSATLTLKQLREIAAAVVPGGFVAVPQPAIDWLMGEGPDAAGFWFGDHPDDQRPKGAFWWRSNFRAMLAASPLPQEKEPGP